MYQLTNIIKNKFRKPEPVQAPVQTVNKYGPDLSHCGCPDCGKPIHEMVKDEPTEITTKLPVFIDNFDVMISLCEDPDGEFYTASNNIFVTVGMGETIEEALIDLSHEITNDLTRLYEDKDLIEQAMSVLDNTTGQPVRTQAEFERTFGPDVYMDTITAEEKERFLNRYRNDVLARYSDPESWTDECYEYIRKVSDWDKEIDFVEFKFLQDCLDSLVLAGSEQLLSIEQLDFLADVADAFDIDLDGLKHP